MRLGLNSTRLQLGLRRNICASAVSRFEMHVSSFNMGFKLLLPRKGLIIVSGQPQEASMYFGCVNRPASMFTKPFKLRRSILNPVVGYLGMK